MKRSTRHAHGTAAIVHMRIQLGEQWKDGPQMHAIEERQLRPPNPARSRGLQLRRPRKSDPCHPLNPKHPFPNEQCTQQVRPRPRVAVKIGRSRPGHTTLEKHETDDTDAAERRGFFPGLQRFADACSSA